MNFSLQLNFPQNFLIKFAASGFGLSSPSGLIFTNQWWNKFPHDCTSFHSLGQINEELRWPCDLCHSIGTAFAFSLPPIQTVTQRSPRSLDLFRCSSGIIDTVMGLTQIFHSVEIFPLMRGIWGKIKVTGPYLSWLVSWNEMLIVKLIGRFPFDFLNPQIVCVYN